MGVYPWPYLSHILLKGDRLILDYPPTFPSSNHECSTQTLAVEMSVLISRRPSVAISPASMPLPLASPADKGARTPEQLRKVLQVREQVPRKGGYCPKLTFHHQLETPGIEERFASDLNNAPRYTNGSGTVQNGSSVPASLARVQNGYGVHGVEVMRQLHS